MSVPPEISHLSISRLQQLTPEEISEVFTLEEMREMEREQFSALGSTAISGLASLITPGTFANKDERLRMLFDNKMIYKDSIEDIIDVDPVIIALLYHKPDNVEDDMMQKRAIRTRRSVLAFLATFDPEFSRPQVTVNKST